MQCTEEPKPLEQAETIARKYCGSCHLFPGAKLLDKATWKQNVLPPMAAKLGIDYLYEIPSTEMNANTISIDEWHKILSYYLTNAPKKMATQNRPPVEDITRLFLAKKIISPENSFPSSSFVKIDPGNHWIYAANSFDSTLNIYDTKLKLIKKSNVHGVIVDMDFDKPLTEPGNRRGIMTNIGIMNPNDRTTGTVDSFSISNKGKLLHSNTLVDGLPRPVQATAIHPTKQTYAYVICGFGNNIGALILAQKASNGKFEKKLLRPLPGAIKAYINDYNNDSLPDILVLMAQAQEGIYLLLNKGNAHFDTQEILGFPPIYGSSYFELDDFNNDGFNDILYTCGDNADYTSNVLKYYHGIYIFLNDRHNHFSQKYFFPIHGCFKAMARDFDKDGDLDIVSLSSFPDTANQPKEVFVYLEQKGSFQFQPFTIKEFNEGKWLTMDAGDCDGDGDEDIVLGGFVPPVASQQEVWKKSGKQKAELLLLENKKIK
jgi:hypothetical protein